MATNQKVGGSSPSWRATEFPRNCKVSGIFCFSAGLTNQSGFALGLAFLGRDLVAWKLHRSLQPASTPGAPQNFPETARFLGFFVFSEGTATLSKLLSFRLLLSNSRSLFPRDSGPPPPKAGQKQLSPQGWSWQGLPRESPDFLAFSPLFGAYLPRRQALSKRDGNRFFRREAFPFARGDGGRAPFQPPITVL